MANLSDPEAIQFKCKYLHTLTAPKSHPYFTLWSLYRSSYFPHLLSLGYANFTTHYRRYTPRPATQNSCSATQLRISLPSSPSGSVCCVTWLRKGLGRLMLNEVSVLLWCTFGVWYFSGRYCVSGASISSFFFDGGIF